MLGIYLLVMGLLFVGVCGVIFKLDKLSEITVLIGGSGMLCIVLGVVFILIETLLQFV